MKTVASLTALALGCIALGQSGVQAVYKDGQTFVTFDEGANPSDWFEVYISDTPILLTANGVRVGLPFRDEWRGQVLRDGAMELLGHDVTWRVPASGGGFRNLGASEGLFVNTVRSTGVRYYSVVAPGATVVLPGQQAAVTQLYDPVNEPVKPVFQFSKTINNADNFVFATWRMGDDNPANDRPDFPVTANLAKNGMPYVFDVAQPVGGPGQGPYPLTVALHGGQGHWWQFRPGFYGNIGNQITSGLMLGPADDITYLRATVQTHSMTKWFGFAESFDPLSFNSGFNPPPGTVVRNYTQRLLDWNISYLLRPTTGLEIDTERISVWGHSAGGRGASLYSRYRPRVVSAAYLYCPALVANVEDTPNGLFGDVAADLPTNLKVGGQPVTFWNAVHWDVRLSDDRDIPFTKVWSGKMEFEDGVGPWNHWSAERVAQYTSANASRHGFHLFWDRRDHGVPDWSTDDPQNSWPDIGEWIGTTTLSRTLRDNTVDLERFRLHQSYPAFFDSDEDANTPGRQPDPGNGDPFDGADWGTWSGYIDWDENKIVDTPKSWSCVAWLVGLSPVAVDNYPGATLTVSLVIRRPQKFRVTAGRLVAWRVKDEASGSVLKSGVATVASDGLVTVPGIVLAKDPARRRIEVVLLPLAIGPQG